MREAVASINASVEAGDKEALLTALLLEEARLSGVTRDNLQWYLDILAKTQKDNARVGYCNDVMMMSLVCCHNDVTMTSHNSTHSFRLVRWLS